MTSLLCLQKPIRRMLIAAAIALSIGLSASAPRPASAAICCGGIIGSNLAAGGLVAAAVAAGAAAIVAVLEQQAIQLEMAVAKLSSDINKGIGAMDKLLSAQTQEIILAFAKDHAATAQDTAFANYGPMALGPNYCRQADAKATARTAITNRVTASGGIRTALETYSTSTVRDTQQIAEIIDRDPETFDAEVLFPTTATTMEDDAVEVAIAYIGTLTEPRPVPELDNVAPDSPAAQTYEALRRQRKTSMTLARQALVDILSSQLPTREIDEDEFREQWGTHSDTDAPIVDGKVSERAFLTNEIRYRVDAIDYDARLAQQTPPGIMREFVQVLNLNNYLRLQAYENELRQAAMQSAQFAANSDAQTRNELSNLRRTTQGGN